MTKADPIVPPDLEKFTLRQETPYPFRRRGKLQDLPILIDGIRYRTIPDTGASFNAISYSFLQHMSLKKVIAMSDILESCKVGDGRCVEAVGQVDIDVSFPDSPQAVSSQIFRVYDTLADGVTIIVGKPFLDATQTLTKYCWRLVERMRHCPIVPRFMNLMPPQAWLKVYINSIMAFASADTGSELDLVWLDFAIRRDLQISPLNDSDEMRVQLADGRIKQLRGKVCVHFGVLNGVTQNSNQGSDLPQLASLASNLLSKEGLLKGEEATGKQSDEIQDTTKGREMAQLRSVDCSRGNLSRDRPAAVSEVEPQKNCTKVFYVIDELCCDVCLGQETLDSMDAFNAYPEAFVDIMKDKLKAELDKSEPQLCGIFKLQHFQRRWYHFLERHGAQVTNIDGQLSSPPGTQHNIFPFRGILLINAPHSIESRV